MRSTLSYVQDRLSHKKKLLIDAVTTLVYTIQEKWIKKKLSAGVFIDVKGVFDNFLKTQLLIPMIKPGVDGDLIIRTSSFPTDWKIQLVIDRYNNKKSEIETGISQSFPVSSILFLIYISRYLNKQSEAVLSVTSLFYIDSLLLQPRKAQSRR